MEVLCSSRERVVPPDRTEPDRLEVLNLNPVDQVTRNRFLCGLHRRIAVASQRLVEDLTAPSGQVNLKYPDGDRPSRPEESGLSEPAQLDAIQRCVLERACANAMEALVFDILCLMDGVADPEDGSDLVWLGVQLAEPGDDRGVMLHDAFFDVRESCSEGGPDTS